MGNEATATRGTKMMACETTGLTVLSFGGGQDSTTILKVLQNDAAKRAEVIGTDDYLVVMSDTGDEHPATYAHVARVRTWCEDRDIEFHWLKAGGEWHSKTWPNLRDFYNRTKTVGSKAFFKTCTDNLKLKPIYRFLSDYVATQYGMSRSGKFRGKQPLVEFAQTFGKIKVILGIASGEESRVSSGKNDSVWMSKSIERIYPLITWGWDRAECQKQLRVMGEQVPPPSNCMLCPFMSKQELLWLERFHPADFADWCRIEKNKLDANAEKQAEAGKTNACVFGGTKTLMTILGEAQEEFGHWSDDELQDYKMSHGHCSKAKF